MDFSEEKCCSKRFSHENLCQEPNKYNFNAKFYSLQPTLLDENIGDVNIENLTQDDERSEIIRRHDYQPQKVDDDH